mgnify:CR=1 FL=1
MAPREHRGSSQATAVCLRRTLGRDLRCRDSDALRNPRCCLGFRLQVQPQPHREIDVINLRLSSVCLDKRMPQRMKAGPLGEWALGGLTVMARSDTVRVFSAAAEALPRTGVRTMNAAGPKAWAADPVAEILRGWWGEEVDLSYFEREDRRHESVFDVGLIERELGFVAAILP